MIKSEFVQHMGAKLGITADEAERNLNCVINLIYEELHNGNTVQWSGFGKFIVSHRKPRTGHNPRTKQPITINELNTPKFRAGEAFKAAVKLQK